MPICPGTMSHSTSSTFWFVVVRSGVETGNALRPKNSTFLGLMANLQTNLRSQCVIALDQPQSLLRSVNKLFCENTTDGVFATLFFTEYDDSQGACATRIAGIAPLCFSGAMRVLNSSIPQARFGALQRMGLLDGGTSALRRRYARTLHRRDNRIVQLRGRGIRSTPSYRVSATTP